ncbi:MAG TPA: hypothetical protein VD971_02420 [Phycisphaerales bacterium]|nr:hypothetical protein [Phycisphaerales bacterium]
MGRIDGTPGSIKLWFGAIEHPRYAKKTVNLVDQIADLHDRCAR